MKLTDLEVAVTDSKGEFSPWLGACAFVSTRGMHGSWLSSDDVEDSGWTLLRPNDASCPMLLKPTSFEVAYFWVTYLSLTSCPLGGSIKYDKSETDLLRTRTANVYPGCHSFRSLKSLQFSELYKGKPPDRNYIDLVVHFPRDWCEIRVCEWHCRCVEARCHLT
jgi:hypothetical protein